MRPSIQAAPPARQRAAASAARVSLAVAIAASVSGCAAVSDITGAVAGFAAGAVTANPAVGIGVGIVVRAATAESLGRVARVRRRAEHQAIVAAIADAPAGERRTWSLDRKLDDDMHGEVRVIRLIETPLAVCKEIAFSVVEGENALALGDWFTSMACFDGHTWRWAVAEPAVERWVNLQ